LLLGEVGLPLLALIEYTGALPVVLLLLFGANVQQARSSPGAPDLFAPVASLVPRSTGGN
jgi:hypothetical protein